ncbi:hypothetical protein, partial [Pseudomonas viridiflava]|uniref:hypothetical protein n=1 Tax=Pseudomonas viridiflava TaxID=33069 RepID=UPI001AD9CEC2
MSLDRKVQVPEVARFLLDLPLDHAPPKHGPAVSHGLFEHENRFHSNIYNLGIFVKDKSRFK